MAAVFFTARLEVKGNVAVVTSSHKAVSINSKYLHVEKLNKVPEKSFLVMNKYDAILLDNGDGNFEIVTIKSDSFKTKLQQILFNGNADFSEPEKRGIASNILGYLVMMVFIQGLLYMMMYSDDKENGTFKRIGVSPASIGTYLAGHGIFNFLLVFVPTFLIIAVSKLIFNIDIGLSYLNYAWLLALITFLVTSFSLLLSSVFKKAESSNMIGQSIAVLTSLLAGCFYSFDNSHTIMKKIISLLPQKNFLVLIQGIEQGRSLGEYLPQLTYLLVFPVLLLVLSAILVKTKLRHE
jgi:ABC-2 type transport system permease protein